MTPHRFTCIALILVTQLAVASLEAAEGTFRIYWVDVEGGAATLMVTPAGESILIDTGNPGLRDPNRIFKVATRDAGLKRIDHLITTHYHRDHFGGATLLSTLLPIGTVYDNGKFEGMPDNPGKDYFEFPCERRVVMNPGDQLELKQRPSAPEVSIRCLGTRQEFISASDKHPANETICATGREKDRDGSDNANSIVLIVEFGDFRFFDGGDLTWNQEAKLVCPQNLVGQVDVYQVTHHGLDSSNNPIVLQTIRPHVAIMNNGDQKGCLPEVFATLKATPSIAAIYQVHKNLRGDGIENNVADEFVANHKPSAECDGHHIELEVTADSKAYEVRIPSHQHLKRFDTTSK
jgi:competence protein ComEC